MALTRLKSSAWLSAVPVVPLPEHQEMLDPVGPVAITIVVDRAPADGGGVRDLRRLTVVRALLVAGKVTDPEPPAVF